MVAHMRHGNFFADMSCQWPAIFLLFRKGCRIASRRCSQTINPTFASGFLLPELSGRMGSSLLAVRVLPVPPGFFIRTSAEVSAKLFKLSPDQESLGILTLLLWAGVVARRLIGDEPVKVRKLVGELLLSTVFGTGLWALGMLQGLSGYQLIVLAAFASYGGGHALDTVLRLIAQVRGGSAGG